jgi:hypothetical protein
MKADPASVRFCAVLRDAKRAAAGIDPLDDARLWRPPVPRLTRKEGSVDAETDTSDDHHETDQNRQEPPSRPTSPMGQPVPTSRHGRTSTATLAQLTPCAIGERTDPDQREHGSLGSRAHEHAGSPQRISGDIH